MSKYRLHSEEESVPQWETHHLINLNPWLFLFLVFNSSAK